MAENTTEFDDLPENVQDFIKAVVKKIRYRKKVRADVFQELVTHFVDELADIADAEQRQQASDKIIAEFGEPKILGKLIRRGKKRCRPLWKKVLIAGFQVSCILVLLIGLRASTFYIGKPVVKINYAKWLTEKASAGKDPKLNAKLDIDRAIELLDSDSAKLDLEIFNLWPGDMNEAQLQAGQKYLADNAESIQILREAANKPYFWIDYNNPQFVQISLYEALFLDEPKAQNDLIEVMVNWRKLVYMMDFNIRFEVYNGEIDQAIDDCFSVLKIARFCQGEAFFIEQLVGIAIEGAFNGMIKNILNRVEISESQLLAIQTNYKKIVKENERVIDFTGEKVVRLDEIQRGFTDDGKGDGRVLAKGLRFIAKDQSSFFKGFLLGGYPGKKETIDEVEKFFNQADNFFEQTAFEQNKQQLKFKGNFFIWNGSVDFERTSLLCWRFRSDRLALAAILAIKIYQKEKGQMPASLQQLVELGYLDSLPMDPFSDGALGYKITQDDFVLYSVGKDFQDDGGKVEYSDSGKVNQWKGGDYIFWPTRKKVE